MKNREKFKFYEVEINNKKYLFTDGRIKSSIVPDGLFKYDIRHDDINFDPISIEPFVFINYFGSIITNEPLTFINNKDKYIDIENINVTGNEIVYGIDRVAEYFYKINL